MALRAAEKKRKVSGQFMNRVVIAMILAALIFTVVMIFVFVRTGSEPSTLIENVFRFLSVEGGAMALIKSVFNCLSVGIFTKVYTAYPPAAATAANATSTNQFSVMNFIVIPPHIAPARPRAEHDG